MKIDEKKNQEILLQIVGTFKPNEFPEYRGFRCANCQKYINEAWYHWLNFGEYKLPVHLCNDCEPLFEKGNLQIDLSKRRKIIRNSFGNTYQFNLKTTERFGEIVDTWPDKRNPELKSFFCDECGKELDIDPSDKLRKGYHVWWKILNKKTLAELHLHRICGHNLGIFCKDEISNELSFRKFKLPTGNFSYIPKDIELRIAENTLPKDKQHFLIEIPWSDKFLKRVPKEYMGFFIYVLPHLSARTTDVHTALSMEFLPEAFKKYPRVDKTVIATALNLHDNGWFLMSQDEIAVSLGVTGLKLTDKAMVPKEKHAVLGSKKAKQLLDNYAFNPPLTQAQKDLIVKAVLYHDKPENLTGKNIPLEMQIICDLDHLWSFTFENFWQDTLRKGVKPKEYLDNLRSDLGGYFLTDWGRNKAKSLLTLREKEVQKLPNIED